MREKSIEGDIPLYSEIARGNLAFAVGIMVIHAAFSCLARRD